MQGWPRIIHLALFLASLGGALFFYHLLTPDQTSTVQVLVTANSKKLGDVVISEDLRWAEWPKAYDQAHYIHTEDEKQKLLHQTVAGFVSIGEPLTFDKVREPTATSTLAQQISPQHRALTLSFDNSHGEASQLSQGDHVDIMWTHKVKAKTATQVESQLLAENILILARDNSVRGQIKLTLDVKPDLAQKIMLAKEKGKISFLLRGLRCEDPSGLCAISEEGLMLKRQRINYTLGAKTDQRDIK